MGSSIEGIPAVAIMAAGHGSRFGRNKLVQPCFGKPLYQWALDAASSVHGAVYLVTGSQSDRLPVDDPAVCKLVNPNPDLGLGSSVRIAAAAAWERGHRQIVIMLADMPLVSPDTLERLIGSPHPIAACRYPDGHAGVPAIFRDSAMKELLSMNPSLGAQGLLSGLGDDKVLDVPVEELIDVDTPKMLEEAASALEAIRGRS